MARFRGIVQGTRKAVSRLGSASSGLRVEANGWHSGVRVYASAGRSDAFAVFATGGSNGGDEFLLGTLSTDTYGKHFWMANPELRSPSPAAHVVYLDNHE